MYKALHFSPMIPSYNISETASFFKNLMTFSTLIENENYAVLIKDNMTVHILSAGTDIGEMDCYLEVDDLDSLWDSIKDKLSGVKVKQPFDREYGMREFHLIIPETKTLLFVGQVIK